MFELTTAADNLVRPPELTDWSPVHDSLEELISTALAWERSKGV